MNVVKITFKGIDYVISQDNSHSIKEYCKKAGIEMIKGTLPDDQSRLCLKLPHFIEVVNGGRARCTQFDFTPGEWKEDPKPKEVYFRSAQERASAIKKFIKEGFQAKGEISSSQVLAIFPGIGIGTVRRHIRDTLSIEGLAHQRITADEYRRG